MSLLSQDDSIEYPDREYWYRYSYEVDYGGIDYLSFDCSKPTIRLVKELWVVQRHTPKGVWIIRQDAWCNKERFVLNNARKRWAYPTPELALQSFIARKQKQKTILTSQLSNVIEALALAEVMDTKEKTA